MCNPFGFPRDAILKSQEGPGGRRQEGKGKAERWEIVGAYPS